MSIRDEADYRFPLLTTAGRDDRAWAKRILYREERGDKDLMPVQVQFAKKAMNVSDQPT